MARNQEKAQTMLARWIRFKDESVKEPIKRRPYLAELCDDLHEAERWRGQIIKEVRRNTAEIQNAALGEHRIRDINDQINKLLREKRHWERRIKQLGGMSHSSHRSRKGLENMSIGDHRGYLYFGAAKDLPGVRELLELQQKQRSHKNGQRRGGGRGGYYENKDRHSGKLKRSRMQMLRLIDADYYGFGDDDDNALYATEHRHEMKARRSKIRAWERTTGKTAPHKIYAKHNSNQNNNNNHNNNSNNSNSNKRRIEDMLNVGTNTNTNTNSNIGILPINRKLKRRRLRRTKIGAHIPTQAEIDAHILQTRKRLLLAKYCALDDTKEAINLATQVRIEADINQNQLESEQTMAQETENQNTTIIETAEQGLPSLPRSDNTSASIATPQVSEDANDANDANAPGDDNNSRVIESGSAVLPV